MSTINTNPINVNYPVPGVNNNSQGFRDNFASIVTNLNTAATEITDLQNKVVVKQALTGTTINNDMANTLISNASTRSFRATTYNLGNAMAGTVFINVALADVHYGALAGNTTFNFSSWAPAGTQSNVQLNINVPANVAATANSVITFSGNVVLADANNGGSSTLENFSNVGGVVSVTVPYGVNQLNYLISTTDCGNTLYIAPINRPRVATAIQQRSPIPTGFKGDVAGDVAVDATYIYVATGTYDSNIANTTQIVQTYASGNIIRCNSWPSNGGGFIANAPIIFNGTSFGGIVAGTTYYIKTVSNPNITISSTGFDGTPGNAVALSDATGSMAADSYNGNSIWRRIDLATATGNDIVTGNLTVNYSANIGTTLNVTGNITGANLNGPLANGTSNVSIPTVNSTVNTVVAGTTRIAATTSGATITGTLGVSSTITGTTLVSNIATGTAPLTITSTTVVPNLYVARANVSDYDTVTLVNTGTYYPQLVNATSGNLATGANANLSFNAATGNLSTTISSATGNVTAANTVTSAYAIGSVGTAIAAAGTVQANATAITKDNNIVSTVVVGAGVVLPTAVAGMRIYIKNTSANALLVYPATSGIINSLAANAAYSQAANASAFYISSSTTQWYSY